MSIAKQSGIEARMNHSSPVNPYPENEDRANWQKGYDEACIERDAYQSKQHDEIQMLIKTMRETMLTLGALYAADSDVRSREEAAVLQGRVVQRHFLIGWDSVK